MSLVHAHVEVRARLRDPSSGMWFLLLRGNQVRRGVRELQFIGGAVQASRAELKKISRALGISCSQFATNGDLRFQVPKAVQGQLVNIITKLWPIGDNPMQRELQEELRDERKWFIDADLRGCRIETNEANPWRYLEGPDLRHKTRGEPAFYVVRLYDLFVGTAGYNKLRAVVAQDAGLELVSTDEILQHQSLRGSYIPPLYTTFLPK